MELRKLNMNRNTDRPITPWQRSTENSVNTNYSPDRIQFNVPKLQSTGERPTSRRGLKSEIQDFKTISNFNNSETSNRNIISRSSSSSILSNRYANITSQLNSGIMSSRLNTSISANSFSANTNNLDRPVTQQGIAAVRPNTTKGVPQITRLIQDKRYYEGLVQLKIRDLYHETSIISQEVDLQNKERVTFMHYDQRAKDLASELIELQNQLADYNIVVDKMTADVDKSFIDHEVMELSRLNEIMLSKVEVMFGKRQKKEKLLLAIEKDISVERTNAIKIVENMNQSARDKYNELYKQKIEYQKEIDEMQRDLNQLSSRKVSLEENIVLSQTKQEAVKLQSKIMEISEKRDKLFEEEKKKLSPEEEKKCILQKIKQDNADITASERRIAEGKKQIVEIEKELEHMEIDVDEVLSEKLVKYRELCKREKVMEEFMSSFDKYKIAELEKLRKLESGVIICLENISSEMDGEIHFSETQKLSVLNMQNVHLNNDDQDFDNLKEEFFRLHTMIAKINNFNKRLTVESNDLKRNIEKHNNEIFVLEDLDSFKNKLKAKCIELLEKKDRFKNQYPICMQELEDIKKEYKLIKNRLQDNDTYLQINTLDEKLKKISDNNAKISTFIVKEKEQFRYIDIKDYTFSLYEKYNLLLVDSIKSIY